MLKSCSVNTLLLIWQIRLGSYTRSYMRTKKSGANPTLLALEQIAEGLSKLHGKKIRIRDLISE